MTAPPAPQFESLLADSPSQLQLRLAGPEDALCLSVLAMQVFLDTYATSGIRPAIAREVLEMYSQSLFDRAIASSECKLVVAQLQGHLVGFAHVTLAASHELAPPGVQAELFRLYVQEPFTDGKRCIKVGSLLLAQAEQLAASAGVTVLWLTPWVHNQRARAFYAKRGYVDCGLTLYEFEGEKHENRVLAKALKTGIV